MRRWLHSPLIHFLILGGLLFLWRTAGDSYVVGGDRHARRASIVVSEAQIQQLEQDFLQRWGTAPSEAQRQALIQQAIDDEVLYQEARRLRLDIEDHSVRLRIVQKMRAVSTDPSRTEDDLYEEALALGFDDDVIIRRLLRQKMRLVLEEALQPPSEQEVQAYVERHRDQFVQPATVTFSHVFLSARRGSPHLRNEARQVLKALRHDAIPPEAITTLSDPFTLGHELRGRSHAEVARYFGGAFADTVFALTPAQWSGPIASPFGVHLVWVHDRGQETIPFWGTVWHQAGYAILQERAARQRTEALERLRARYDIHIDVSPAQSVSEKSGKQAG
ncbi:peptidylprolyl isomerase [Nitrospira sp. Nam74]